METHDTRGRFPRSRTKDPKTAKVVLRQRRCPGPLRFPGQISQGIHPETLPL